MRSHPFRSSRLALEPLLCTAAVLTLALAIAGCASTGKPPPTITLDEPIEAKPLPEPPQPVEPVAVPNVLPLPSTLSIVSVASCRCNACLTIASPRPEPPRSRERPESTR